MRLFRSVRDRTCIAFLYVLIFAVFFLMIGCQRAIYFCENGKTIEARYQLEGERVVIDVDDGAFTLPKIPSDSGAKYGDGTRTFWFREDELLIESGGKYPFGHCVRPR